MDKILHFSKYSLLQALVVISAFLLPCLAKAYDFKLNGICYNLNSDGTSVTIASADKTQLAKDLIIPSNVTYNGTTFSVTAIGKYAFYGCSGLTSLTIPDSVASIGYHAFEGCNNIETFDVNNNSCANISIIPDSKAKLKNLIIGGSVTSIGDKAFKDCISLTNVTIKESVSSIDNYAFYSCSALTNISIGSSVTHIGHYAFAVCSSIKKVNISDLAKWCEISFDDDGANPLFYAHHLYLNGIELKELTIPQSVHHIAPYAFVRCTGLTDLTIPNSVESIGENAFSGCTGLTSSTLGDAVVAIGSRAFSGCTGLTHLTIGKSTSSIGSAVFENCTQLENVTWNAITSNNFPTNEDYPFRNCPITTLTLGDNVQYIPANFMNSQANISTITIPNSVTEIGYSAFSGCTELKNITWNAIQCKDFSEGHDHPFLNCTFANITIGDCVQYIPADFMFSQSYLSTLTISNSVTEIGNYAFYGCSGLTSLILGNSITTIGRFTFNECSGLTNLVIPNSVTEIGNYAFYGCSGLTSLSIGNSVTEIGYAAFSGCNRLTKLTIPNSVITIAPYAFNDCSGLDYLIIGDSVTTIGDNAFSGCIGITSITIPYSITTIGKDAFSGCSNILTYNIDNNQYANINVISESKTKLQNLIIGNSVTSIGDNAFNGCTGLTSIILGNAVVAIGSRAFSGCTGLTHLTIGKSTSSIGSAVFENCTQLENVTWNAITSNNFPTNEDYPFRNCPITTLTLGDSVRLIPANFMRGQSRLSALIIPTSVTNIRSYAFSGCSSLSNVTIPSTVTAVGHSAFSNCSGLKSLSIPSSIKTINNNTFSGCSGLTSLTIPNTVTTIGDNAFSGCSGLTSLTIPSSVTTIGNNIFADVDHVETFTVDNKKFVNINVIPSSQQSLKQLIIGSSITSISDNAFNGCSGLTSITIPSSVTQIGNGAFNGCTALTMVNIEDLAKWSAISFKDNSSNPLVYAHHLYLNGSEVKDLTIPLTITKIGQYTFSGCSGLTNLVIPKTITCIDYSAFSGCNGLTSLTIPNSVTTIDNSSFAGVENVETFDIDNNKYANINTIVDSRKSLKHLIIGNSVTTITDDAFSGCSGLTNISISNSVSDIGSRAFYECSSLSNLVIPGSVITINKAAFSGCSGLTNLDIPNSVTTISESAFSGCSGLTCLSIPSSVTSISKAAFSGCSGLTDLVIPNSVTTISEAAFSGCSGLTSIGIPNTITSIGNMAFSDCSRLTSIAIPNTVTAIGNFAFNGCSGLENIDSYIEDPSQVQYGVLIFNNVPKASCKLNIPLGTYNIYVHYYPWSEFLNIIPIFGQHVTSITMDTTTIELFAGGTFKIVPTVLPSNASDKSLNWSSSDNNIITVDNYGTITAKKVGTAIITATANDGSGVTTSCQVNVTGTAKIELNTTETNLFVDHTVNLSAIFKPEELILKEVTWTSNAPSVAKVDNNGTVTAKNIGTAIITATATDGSGVSASCTITVIPDYQLTSAMIQHTRGSKASVIELPIALDNIDAVSQLQFDITMPVGISVEGEYDTSTGRTYYDNSIRLDNERKTRAHFCDINLINNNTYRVIVSSTVANSTLKGNHGNLVYLIIKIPQYHDAGDFPIVYSNFVLNGAGSDEWHNGTNTSSVIRLNYLLGDANADVTVDIADYQATARTVLSQSTPRFYKDAANVVEDNDINAGDLQGIINLVAGIDSITLKHAPHTRYSNNEVSLISLIDSKNHVTLSLCNTVAIGTMQMDLTIPDDMRLKEANVTSRGQAHNVVFAVLPNKKVRILLSSPSGAIITPGGDGLIELTFDGCSDGSITIDNIIAVERNLTMHHIDQNSFEMKFTNVADKMVNSDAKIHIEDNHLVIDSDISGIAHLVNINGTVSELHVSIGHNVLELSPGAYIVRFGKQTAKIAIR